MDKQFVSLSRWLIYPIVNTAFSLRNYSLVKRGQISSSEKFQQGSIDAYSLNYGDLHVF